MEWIGEEVVPERIFLALVGHVPSWPSPGQGRHGGVGGLVHDAQEGAGGALG